MCSSLNDNSSVNSFCETQHSVAWRLVLEITFCQLLVQLIGWLIVFGRVLEHDLPYVLHKFVNRLVGWVLITIHSSSKFLNDVLGIRKMMSM